MMGKAYRSADMLLTLCMSMILSAMTEAGRVLYRSSCDGNVYSLQLINSFHYEMPKTGGAGVTLYRSIGGSLMMAAALLAVIKKRRPSAV